MRIAVLGAGISSASFVHHLGHSADVTVFDKARGVGGRMAHRLVKGVGDFDHGAQFFTARTKAFRNTLQPLIDSQVVSLWGGNIGYLGRVSQEAASQAERYVANPSNALVKKLLDSVDLQLNRRIIELRRINDHWSLICSDGVEYVDFDLVVLSLPPAQAMNLIKDHWEPVEAAIEMEPCFCVMLGYKEEPQPDQLPWDAAFVADGIINWFASNQSKGRSGDLTCITLHGAPIFSKSFSEANRGQMEKEITDEFFRITGRQAKNIVHCSSHFWRYAKPREEVHSERPFVINKDAGLALIGDYLAGGRVEGGYSSGRALAASL